MALLPGDIFLKLEMDKVLTMLEKSCLGELAKKKVQQIEFQTQKFLIDRLLNEVSEFVHTSERHHHFPITGYDDIAKDVRYLEVEGSVLELIAVQRIRTILWNIQEMLEFFNKGFSQNETRRQGYPALYDIIKTISFDDYVMQYMDRVLDDEGEIRPDASPELLRLKKARVSKMRELDKQFRQLMGEYKQKGWLKDSVESVRNGRRVFTVPAEHKRKIRGIIHDESATGKTAFLEPDAIIDINNDLFDIDNEERREIFRILKSLSDQLRPYCPQLLQYQVIIVRYDLIRAKAKLAKQMDAVKPKIEGFPILKIEEGRHPLLLLKNRKESKKTIPFNMVLEKNRILVLSGPNAGGKSVALKSVGLLQLMVQMGLLVPVKSVSVFGVFESVFADIGDQQSLDDDLSTYSSHLHNMKEFLNASDESTLVLIDEFGTGTDPAIGGAIAESILKEFNKKKVFAVITTHYSNLKIFAHRAKGLVNGAMKFDKDTLSPTYELKIGRPGSSYAFEIAVKTGLDAGLIKEARVKAGKKEGGVDQLLVDLQREKQEVEQKLANLREKETQMQKLVKAYESIHLDLEFKKKKMKLEKKEIDLQETARENKALENLVRQLKEEKNLEKAKEMVQKAKAKRAKLNETVSDLKEDIFIKNAKTKAFIPGELKVGDFVKLRSGGATGKVESIDKKNVTLLVGMIRMTVKLRDLEGANAPLEINKTKSINHSIKKNLNFQTKLDIRGVKMGEAMEIVQQFVDEALMSNISQLQIVHGKGNGILRLAVKNKLREYKEITEVYHPADNMGGDGVTFIKMD